MSKIIYLVTSGEYSDYHVEAAYSTHERAERHPGLPNIWDDPRIEEVFLDPPKLGVRYTAVTMGRDGKLFAVEHSFRRKLPDKEEIYNWSLPLSAQRNGIRQVCLFMLVRTGDVKRAVKVTNEKRSMILALDLWGDERGLALVC